MRLVLEMEIPEDLTLREKLNLLVASGQFGKAVAEAASMRKGIFLRGQQIGGWKIDSRSVQMEDWE